MKPLVVGILVTTISRLGGGVAEAIRNQALALNERGVEVIVITLRDKYFDEDVAAWSGIRILAYKQWGPKILGLSPLMLVGLRAVKPDIVHVHGVWQFHCLMALIWSWGKNRPYVVSPHGMLEGWIRQRSVMLKRFASVLFHDRFLRNANAFQALTCNEGRDVTETVENARIAVIPNFVPSVPGDDARPLWWTRVLEGRQIYLFLGRLHPKKGCEEICDAWTMFCEDKEFKSEDVALVFCGWNDGFDGFETKIAGLFSRFSNVYFVGPQHDIQKWRSLRAANFLLLPSKSEGLPMVILECWAVGKPVIMTDECNIPMGFERNAAIRTGKDAISIYESFKVAYNLDVNQVTSMGKRGKSIIDSFYNSEFLTKKLNDLYMEIINGEKV